MARTWSASAGTASVSARSALIACACAPSSTSSPASWSSGSLPPGHQHDGIALTGVSPGDGLAEAGTRPRTRRWTWTWQPLLRSATPADKRKRIVRFRVNGQPIEWPGPVVKRWTSSNDPFGPMPSATGSESSPGPGAVRALGDEAQMEEIAADAGVGMGTLYRHFPNKQALLTAIARARFQCMTELARRPSRIEDPGEALEAVLGCYLETAEATPPSSSRCWAPANSSGRGSRSRRARSPKIDTRIIERAEAAGRRPSRPHSSTTSSMLLCGITSTMYFKPSGPGPTGSATSNWCSTACAPPGRSRRPETTAGGPPCRRAPRVSFS